MFFTLLKISTKQLKLRDSSRNPTPMPKLAFEGKKICFIHKKLSLHLYLGYVPIYWQIRRDQPQLGFLFLVDLEVLSEFYLDSDPSLDI
jgi:hypothetical protein